MRNKWLIAIMGPTASGKTGVAVSLAKKYAAPVISVDSRQFFKELSIGTAKPSVDEMEGARHYFIDNLSIKENYSAAAFAEDAEKILAEIFSSHDIAIAAGGSTLYYRALLNGIDDFPEISEEAKMEVRSILENTSVEGLANKLLELDPAYYVKVDRQNSRRLSRALEVCLSAGIPYSAYLNKGKSSREYSVIKIGLDWPREELYKRINERCEQMLNNGLLEEVKTLLPFQGHQALSTVGYAEFFDYLNNKISYEEAVDKFKQHTRNYAKRQLTWFRKDKEIRWFSPNDLAEITTYIEERIKEVL